MRFVSLAGIFSSFGGYIYNRDESSLVGGILGNLALMGFAQCIIYSGGKVSRSEHALKSSDELDYLDLEREQLETYALTDGNLSFENIERLARGEPITLDQSPS